MRFRWFAKSASRSLGASSSETRRRGDDSPSAHHRRLLGFLTLPCSGTLTALSEPFGSERSVAIVELTTRWRTLLPVLALATAGENGPGVFKGRSDALALGQEAADDDHRSVGRLAADALRLTGRIGSTTGPGAKRPLPGRGTARRHRCSNSRHKRKETYDATLR